MLLWYVLAVQCGVAAFKIAVGLASIGIARRVRAAHPLHGAGWWVVGVAFSVAGAVALVGSTGAAIAVISGPETAVYAFYLRWATVVNQSKTGIETAMGLLLIALAVWRASPARVLFAAPWVLAVGFVAGAVAGLPILEFDAATFFELAIATGTEFAALVVALARNSMDWMLWVLVLIRAVSQAITMLVYATMSWFRVDGAWYVPSEVLQTYLMAVMLAMLGMSLWRLRCARRGTAVPAMLDRFRAPPDRSMALPRASTT